MIQEWIRHAADTRKRAGVALLISQGTVLSQVGCSCLPEGITFNTQAQVDSFRINYPGCVEIEGNVYIQSSGQLNLNGLTVLNAIGGNLTICCSDHLASLAGLENIHSVGGDLQPA